MEKTITGKVTRTAAILVATVACAAALACAAAQPALADDAQGVEMQRLYNPNSGEHFYTASPVEADHLVSVGWSHEGTGWTAPATSATPVFRLYNANAGDHHYTTSAVERDHLVDVGWSYEGIGWHSDDAQGVALFRQYNPNAIAGSHNYTTSEAERDHLVGVGWSDEGIAWYGVDPDAAAPAEPGDATEPGPGDDAQVPPVTEPTQPGGQDATPPTVTTPDPVDPEPATPEPVACKHQWENVWRAEEYVISEAYDYQRQVHVADQWQCQCLELFDTPEALGEHQDYHYDNGTIKGHGRSRVVPVYEYETVHVPAKMGTRNVFVCTRCVKCGKIAEDL